MTTTAPVTIAAPARPRRPWWVSLLDVGDPIVRAADDPRAWATDAHAGPVPAQRRPTP